MRLAMKRLLAALAAGALAGGNPALAYAQIQVPAHGPGFTPMQGPGRPDQGQGTGRAAPPGGQPRGPGVPGGAPPAQSAQPGAPWVPPGAQTQEPTLRGGGPRMVRPTPQPQTGSGGYVQPGQSGAYPGRHGRGPTYVNPMPAPGAGPRPPWQGDISRFHDYDLRLWQSGRWRHAWHDGRQGWWWIVSGIWYFYPARVYPYPDPFAPPFVAAPAGQAYWYYCPDYGQYYPYVAVCPGGWVAVLAQP